MRTAIRVENLGKMYRIGFAPEKYRTLRDHVVDAIHLPARWVNGLRNAVKQPSAANSQENIIWALKNVSFEVEQGKVLGVVGRNGAGKSTLLKILSRITEPTEGFAEIRGRVGSCLLYTSPSPRDS